MQKEWLVCMQGAVTAACAWLADRLGVLYPVLFLLMGMMVLDYITGMLASKAEAIDHPGDSAYGWSSRKGSKGIIKKVGYLCVIAAAMVVDYIILNVAKEIGITMPTKAFFGLLVAIWYLLNELLSIIENAGRMGANVPEWLRQYIAVLRDKIDADIDSDPGGGQ